jgi:hypothetical protein
MSEKETLFEYMRREHNVLLLQTEEIDIIELISPRAYPCTINDSATEAEIQFGIYLTGMDRETLMQCHREMCYQEKQFLEINTTKPPKKYKIIEITD